jgi:sugar phosphate isomerase/epimerase
MQQVLISLSSFGAAETLRHGQLYFARLARAAGADGFEVRGELLLDAQRELPALAQAGRGAALVYSSPEGLWAADGTLDRAALARALDATRVLGAPRLKMSIGNFSPSASGGFAELAQALRAGGVELVIENDQTVSAGTLPALLNFFDAADRAGIELGMTFDMGNWHWLGECPLQAAQALGRRVRYVHCKGAQRLPAKWVAVPLAESVAPWRAVLRALPADVPHAIEYPLIGDDLLSVTREQIAHIRATRATP